MKQVFILFALSFTLGPARATTFQVKHDHLRGSCEGDLIFNEATVEYRTRKAEHAHVWNYEDIQQVEIAPGRISILTYENKRIALGADRIFSFKVISGELNDDFRRQIQGKLSRPLVSSIVPVQAPARYTIPVRHRRALGGDSEGVLELAGDYVVYRSRKPKDSRIWLYEDLLSFGSTGPFQLRLGALQKTGGEYGEERNYVFDLKRRLKPEEYDFIWEKINRPHILGK